MEEEQDLPREKLILERILSLKQMLADGIGGPLEFHELGICYYLLEDLQGAKKYLGELITDYPDYLEIGSVHALRIYIMIREGQMKSARTLAEERIDIIPDDTRLLGMLAYIEEKSGHEDRAIVLHRRTLELDPENKNSLNALGYLLAMQNDRALDAEAFSCLRKAVSMDPDHPAYLDSLGALLQKQGNIESAKKAFMKALRRDPTNGEILDRLRTLAEKPSGPAE